MKGFKLVETYPCCDHLSADGAIRETIPTLPACLVATVECHVLLICEADRAVISSTNLVDTRPGGPSIGCWSRGRVSTIIVVPTTIIWVYVVSWCNRWWRYIRWLWSRDLARIEAWALAEPTIARCRLRVHATLSAHYSRRRWEWLSEWSGSCGFPQDSKLLSGVELQGNLHQGG